MPEHFTCPLGKVDVPLLPGMTPSLEMFQVSRKVDVPLLPGKMPGLENVP